jgi:ABC-type nitrate/sulfonate/bicarbonate transport system substrate-binding protein
MLRTGLRLLLAVSLLVVELVGSPTNGRAGDVVRLAFSSFSATNAGFLAAIEEKLFEKRGIELIPIYIASSSIALPAVLTREVDFATLSGEAAVRAYHQGARSLAVIGTQLDKFTFSLYTKPEIKIPQDLRGKILGVSRFGGSLDISLRYGLQHVGLDPKRDNITVVQVGGMPEIMASLTSGKLDGAMLLSVYAFRGKEMGYRELWISPGGSWPSILTGSIFSSRIRALVKKRWPDSPASRKKNISMPTMRNIRKNI